MMMTLTFVPSFSALGYYLLVLYLRLLGCLVLLGLDPATLLSQIIKNCIPQMHVRITCQFENDEVPSAWLHCIPRLPCSHCPKFRSDTSCRSLCFLRPFHPFLARCNGAELEWQYSSSGPHLHLSSYFTGDGQLKLLIISFVPNHGWVAPSPWLRRSLRHILRTGYC